jgi:hypothetical protein
VQVVQRQGVQQPVVGSQLPGVAQDRGLRVEAPLGRPVVPLV